MGVILIVGLAAFFGTSRHGAALGSAGSSIRHSISSTLSFSLPLGSGAQRPVTVTGLHLRNAASIAVDRRGNVFVSEPDSNRIDKLSSGGKLLGRIGAAGAAPGRLDAPAGLATDPRGNIYVGDLGHDRVQELTSSGRPLRLWGTNGQRAGQFSSPSGIALDAQGNIYVTEEDNRRIQKLSPSGKPLAVWGGAQSGEFDTPRGIAVDRHSTIYVGDFGDQSAGSRIEKLSPSGRTLAVWGAGSPSSPDAFYFTGGVAVDGKNRVYAAAGDADRGGTHREMVGIGRLAFHLADRRLPSIRDRGRPPRRHFRTRDRDSRGPQSDCEVFAGWASARHLGVRTTVERAKLWASVVRRGRVIGTCGHELQKLIGRVMPAHRSQNASPLIHRARCGRPPGRREPARASL